MSMSIGVDIVHVPSFKAQLEIPSTFSRVFSAAEWGKHHVAPYHHLAGLWAAKEAFIKAWSGSRAGKPPLLADIDYATIEVLNDEWGRPLYRLSGEIKRLVGPVQLSLSISHDEDYAIAQCLFMA